MNPLDLGVLNEYRLCDAWNDEFHGNLSARLDNQAALELRATERKIDGFTLDFVGIRLEQTFDLRRNTTMLTAFHNFQDTCFSNKKHAPGILSL